MAQNARRQAQRIAIAKEVARLSADGLPLCQIAERTGVSKTTAWRYQKEAEALWRAEAVDNVGTMRQRELERLDRLEAELTAAWESSKKPQVAITRFVAGDSTSTTEHQRNRDGCPRIAAQLLGVIAQRRKLLGLDAPKPEDERTRLTEQLADVFCALLERHLYRHPEILRRILGDIGAMRGRREPDMLDAEIEPADAPDDPDNTLEESNE